MPAAASPCVRVQATRRAKTEPIGSINISLLNSRQGVTHFPKASGRGIAGRKIANQSEAGEVRRICTIQSLSIGKHMVPQPANELVL